MACLNRTSVGLKQNRILPQADFRARLNRTSVGLKRFVLVTETIQDFLPQSNQRGIETVSPEEARIVVDKASIEPAWD